MTDCLPGLARKKDMRERPASESVAGFVVEAMLLLGLAGL